MKKLILNISLLCNVLLIQAQIAHHGTLKVGYDNTTELPANTVVGVNGRVFFYNGEQTIASVSFREDIVKEFALVVAGSQVQLVDENDDPLCLDASGNQVLCSDASAVSNVMVDEGGGIVSRDLGLGTSAAYMNIPDYVFEEDYDMSSLEEVEAFVKEYKHLPGVIGKDELKEQGYFMVTEMLFGQLKNLEELILHTIEQEKQIKAQEEENQRLRELALALEKRLEALEAKE